MTGIEPLANGWLVTWAASRFHPSTFEEVTSWAYAGLKSLVSEMKPPESLQPHILVVTREGAGMLELPESSVATANAVRRLTEEVLTGLVARHHANALVLITTGRFRGKECILMAVDDSKRAGLFMIRFQLTTFGLQLGQLEPLPDADLLLKRVVMTPFLLAKRLN